MEQKKWDPGIVDKAVSGNWLWVGPNVRFSKDLKTSIISLFELKEKFQRIKENMVSMGTLQQRYGNYNKKHKNSGAEKYNN